MKKVFGIALIILGLSSCTNYIYIVRHAEKATSPANDPPLTAAGQQRAEALSVLLSTKNIAAIFSTNTSRTTQTATPLSNTTGKPITLYSNDTMSLFVNRLQQFRSNVLVVGHSNTVLQLLDSFHLAHNIQNIADNDFDNLFIIKTKRFLRTTTSLTETTYGTPSP